MRRLADRGAEDVLDTVDASAFCAGAGRADAPPVFLHELTKLFVIVQQDAAELIDGNFLWIDLACIEPGLLTDAERQWLNDYHRRVLETVAPQVDEATRTWLAEATRAI